MNDEADELNVEGVFVLYKPSDMLSKLEWEIAQLTKTMFGQMGRPEAISQAGYQAFNCAVTAWHLADWTWAHANDEGKNELAKGFGLSLKNRDRDNRDQFFEATARASPRLFICRF